MRRHTFDPISAALGLIAILLGVLVTFNRAQRLDHQSGWWIAAIALVLGLALVPWRRRSRTDEVRQPGE